MVRDAFGSSDEASAIRADKAQEERPNAERAIKMKAMWEYLAGGERYRTRVVYMGKAIFGPGTRGPYPRKKLLKAMAHRGCVILIDEYLTSQRCCGCGGRMVQQGNSRMSFCVNWNRQGCTVGPIDRDRNAAIIIAMIGARQLLGLPRPFDLEYPGRRASPSGAEQATAHTANQGVVLASQGLRSTVGSVSDEGHAP